MKKLEQMPEWVQQFNSDQERKEFPDEINSLKKKLKKNKRIEKEAQNTKFNPKIEKR